jgi:hypothetical protein
MWHGTIAHPVEHELVHAMGQAAHVAAPIALLAAQSTLLEQGIARAAKTVTQHLDIPPTKLLRQALLRVILAGFGMDSSFLNLSFTW